MPTLKEPNFFSGPPHGVPYAAGGKRIKRLDEYESLFDPATKARGEASPNYTAYPLRLGTPERIKEVIPHAKFIYLVRDPVIRAVLHYHHYVSRMGEGRSLEDALGKPPDLKSLYVCTSLYALQLEQYLRHFREEQVLVVDQVDLRTARQATLREIFAFLSVDDTFVSPRFEEQFGERSKRRTYSRFVTLVALARRTPLQRLPQGFRVAMRDAVERLVSMPLPVPDLDDELRSRLQELYARDVERLRELTGKPFSSWSV